MSPLKIRSAYIDISRAINDNGGLTPEVLVVLESITSLCSKNGGVGDPGEVSHAIAVAIASVLVDISGEDELSIISEVVN